MSEASENKETDDIGVDEETCCDLSKIVLEGNGNKAVVIAAGTDHVSSDLRDTILKQVNFALKRRENVVMTRLNDDILNKLDALVEIELFKSRSEAAAFFIVEGVDARKDLFDKVMPTMEEIRRLKEELRKSIS